MIFVALLLSLIFSSRLNVCITEQSETGTGKRHSNVNFYNSDVATLTHSTVQYCIKYKLHTINVIFSNIEY